MVFGNLSTGYWLGAAAAAGLHWVELGRTTLGSAGDSIDTSTFSTKDNIMILEHKIPTGNARSKYRFNSDSGSNYATRRNQNGGSDGTFTSESFLYQYHTGGTAEGFSVSQYNNVSAQEKLGIAHVVENNGSGASNAPNRDEYVQKWANTSAQINRVEVFNDGTGDFNTGSEVVVLGYDPDDTEGGSVWEELADVTLGSAGDTITTSTFTAKKYLMVQTHGIASGNIEAALQVGNGSIDTGSNYAVRWQVNGTEGTGTSKTSIDTNHTASGNEYINYFIVNVAAKEKLVIAELIDSNSAGAGNAPNRVEHVGKWTNTSNQINIVQAKNVGSGSFDTGSSIKVWGFD